MKHVMATLILGSFLVLSLGCGEEKKAAPVTPAAPPAAGPGGAPAKGAPATPKKAPKQIETN